MTIPVPMTVFLVFLLVLAALLTGLALRHSAEKARRIIGNSLVVSGTAALLTLLAFPLWLCAVTRC